MKLEELIKDKKISCFEEGKITHLGIFNKKEGLYRCYDARECDYQYVKDNFPYCTLVLYNK
jgi:hypothetical protein